MRDVVIDLETLGKTEHSLVVSAGLVEVDLSAHKLVNSLKVEFDIINQPYRGAVMDVDTVAWWLKQSASARDVFERCIKHGTPVPQGLMVISGFIMGADPNDPDAPVPNPDVRVWGNGSSFDNVILRAMYSREGLLPPWEYWNDRDLRTMKTVYEMIAGQKFVKRTPDTAHDALEDATAQALDLIDLVRDIRRYASPEFEEVLDS